MTKAYAGTTSHAQMWELASQTAVQSFCRTLSSLLGVDLPTTLLFDHPNTEMCATFVAVSNPRALKRSSRHTMLQNIAVVS